MRRLLVTIALIAATSGAYAQQRAAAVVYRPTLLIQLGVSNLDRAIAFYADTLGFEMTERRNDLKFAHIATNVPGLQIGLSETADAKGTGSAVLNIGVADVVAARKALEARGVLFKGDTVIIPGKVALASFADPDGNTLRVAGPPPK